MSHNEPRRASRRRTRSTTLAVLVVVVAFVGVLGYRSLDSSSPASPVISAPLAHRPPNRLPGRVPGSLQGGSRDALGVADGEVPDGVTVFDDAYPAVANLDPALLRALRQAARDAAREGITFYVNSGWRSPAYQRQLLDEAISTYGSRADAARWVATPRTSPHVSGDAVDIGHPDAATWLSEHGARYGLCQIYGNEPWHYELRPDAVDHGCPAMYADPTQDPRMQQ